MIYPIKEPKTFKRHPIVRINGFGISVVRETVYLGIRLDLFLHYRSHLRLQTHKAIQAVSKVAYLAKSDYSGCFSFTESVVNHGRPWFSFASGNGRISVALRKGAD